MLEDATLSWRGLSEEFASGGAFCYIASMVLLFMACAPQPASPPEVPGAQASFTAADAAGGWGLPVTLDDGTRLLGGAVPAAVEPGEALTLTALFAPASPAADVAIEGFLWRSGAGEPLAEWRWQTERWPGEVVQLSAAPTVPADAKPGDYWIMWRLTERGGEPIDADAFGGGRITLGNVAVGGSPPKSWRAAGFLGGPTLAVGGDVNLGRRTNAVLGRRGPDALLAGVPGLVEADLAYANLECAVGVGGEQGVDKGERAPFYYRGRPETVGALTAAGVDVVGVGNNHSGDYGPALLLAQDALLAEVGISQTGAGPDADSACGPVYRQAGELTVAFLAADTTQPRFAAGEGPGACYADIERRPTSLAERLEPHIEAARERADLVFVGLHWGDNRKSRPTRSAREAGRALIDAGADAVLGSSAHVLQGVEVHAGRPILYDAGNLLFDAIDGGESTRSGLFTLGLDPDGVLRLVVTPLDVGFGVTTEASGNSAARTLTRLRDLSAELGTPSRFHEGRLIVDLPQPPPRPPPRERAAPDAVGDAAPAPAAAPPPGCVLTSAAEPVPEGARLAPVQAGGMTLLGARLETTRISARRGIWLESWWSVPEATAANHLIEARVTFELPSSRTTWEADHEPCDWGWPTSRWVAGDVHYDRYLLRPRPTLPDGVYTVTLGGVEVGTIDVGE